MMESRENPNIPLTLRCTPTCNQDMMETMVSLERAVDTLEREVCFDLESYELWVYSPPPPLLLRFRPHPR